MPATRIQLTLTALMLAALAACGRTPAAAPVPTAAAPSAGACVVAGEGPSAERLTVAFTEPLSPSRPAEAATRAAAIIFRHLYEPLVRVTCDGHVLPGAAESWTTPDSGRSWIFKLRRTLRFWDDSGVPTSEILESWKGYETEAGYVPWAGIARARVVDDQRVAVYMKNPSAEFPKTLGDHRLAIAVQLRRSEWPMGTGPYRPVLETDSTLTVEWWDGNRRRPEGAPKSIDFISMGTRGARDRLDQGLDALIAEDSTLLAYAVARGMAATPLPWDRTYVLFVPTNDRLHAPVDGPRDGFLESVARDAVGAEAQVSPRGQGWRAEACPRGASAGVDPVSQARRVVYFSEDATARELAHRLVAFAGAPGQGGEWLVEAYRQPTGARTFPFAVGLERSAWQQALARGNEVAFVIGLPGLGEMVCARPGRPEGAWFPLIDTRVRVALRPGAGAWSADHDGVPHVRDLP